MRVHEFDKSFTAGNVSYLSVTYAGPARDVIIITRYGLNQSLRNLRLGKFGVTI